MVQYAMDLMCDFSSIEDSKRYLWALVDGAESLNKIFNIIGREERENMINMILAIAFALERSLPRLNREALECIDSLFFAYEDCDVEETEEELAELDKRNAENWSVMLENIRRANQLLHASNGWWA